MQKALDDFILELNQVYYDYSPFWCKEEKNTFRGQIQEEVDTRIVKTLGYKVPKHKTRSKLIDIRAYKKRISNNQPLFVVECSNVRYGLFLVKSNIQSINEHFSQYPGTPKYIFISFGYLLRKHGKEMLRTHKPTIIEFGFQLLPEGEYTRDIRSQPLNIETYKEMEKIISEVVPRCPI